MIGKKNKWIFVGLFLVLASCTRVENLAASFIPTGHQNYDASELKSGFYQLDPEHSSLHISFDHMGFSTTVARFDRFGGGLTFDKDSPHTSKLEITINLASINTNNPAFDNILKGTDYFDTDQFPEAVFTADEVFFIDGTTGDGTTGEVPGALTLNGVTQPVVLNVTFRGGAKNWISGDYTLGFEATTTVQRSAFGLKKLLPLTGDNVTIDIHAEFKKE